MIPTVMIPGTLCDASLFASLTALLPGHRPTIADITPFSTVGDAAASILAMAPDRFLCIGFSLGGFIALEMLRMAPGRLLGIVLISGNAHPDRIEHAAQRRADAAAARDRGIEAIVAANLATWGLAALPAVARQVAAMAQAVGAEAFARQCEMNIARPDLRAVAAAAPVPLLVIAGSDDPLCPRERYTAAAAVPNGHLTILPGRGHYLPLEAPGEVADALGVLKIAT